MGEQSTSWTVDLTWTGQVELHRTADVADINAQPESTSDQRSSSPLDMPPSTRSLAVNTLDTLSEEPNLQNLEIKDDSGEANPVPRTPTDNGPAEEREGTDVRTTPKSRKITQSVSSVQRDAARDADPNDGRCLLTNRVSAVQLCHVIAKSTEGATLTKLEYVWQIGYRKFHLDTGRNMMHLRSDWHYLFDKPEWVLIPEGEVLQKLNKIYLEDRHTTNDVTQLLVEPTYNYYVLPTPALQEPICRFPDLNNQNHETHFPPFPNLGTVQSHILPHFVVFNTGRKLASLIRLDETIVANMSISLRQIVTPGEDALLMVGMIQNLYRAWMNVQVPGDFRNAAGTSNRSNAAPSEAGHNDPSQGGGPPRREGLRSATSSGGQRSQVSGGRYAGGQQRALHPFQPSEDEESSVTDDTIVDDGTDWIDYIHTWRKQDDSATEKQESDAFNDSGDEQLAAYIKEHARTPPSPGAWDSWKADWDDSKSRYPTASDRSRFSSNDWAAFKNHVYLSRPEYPQATL